MPSDHESEDNLNHLCHENNEGIFIKLLFDAIMKNILLHLPKAIR